MGAYVCGIDIGTSGVKVVILRKDGFISARSSATLPAPIVKGKERFQDASLWWKAVSSALKSAVSILRVAGGCPEEISSICIDATSGTIVFVDENYMPLDAGIMYNDGRAEAEPEILNELGKTTIDKMGYRFNSSFALPKILYMKNNYPELWEKTRYVLHQADFIASKFMSNKCEVLTDASNALKTGYDIIESRWPQYISKLGISEKLPGVVQTGCLIGHVDQAVCKEFGFCDRAKIVAGMTDSVAACVASGARKEGDMNTTLGSTITWKVLSGEIVNDSMGRVYSHLHPSGCFLPGGAGNAGGQGIRSMMNSTPEELTEYAFGLEIKDNAKCFSYPLPSMGERFPFVNSEFKGFTTGNYYGEELYQSLIEGAACIERWGYETIKSLGAQINGTVWTTGGGSMVDVWMKVRASVLDRVIYRARFPESAYGAALIAAMRTWFNGDFVRTADSFILEEARFEPDKEMVKKYEDYYQRFREVVEARM